MVIWITGISGAGKTTISKNLYQQFKCIIPEIVTVDGDEVRNLFGKALGYSEKDRFIQIERVQRIAAFLDKQGMLVLVSALYSHPKLLSWNRKNFSEYFEIYLKTSIDLVSDRDPKGLYRKFFAGEMQDVVGLDIVWHAPKNPDLSITMDKSENLCDTSNTIISRIDRLANATKFG